ncbi:MAG: 3-deoxy-8-phosphooctulonate synthase, partial [Bacteroidota bacterium]
VEATGNRQILLTERGTTFGYNNLVVDMRSLTIMRKTGYPVVLDATHSVQRPGGERTKSGGEPEFIFPIARAGAAVGIDALFIETHPNPARALSDAASQLKLSLVDKMLKQVVALDRSAKKFLH